MQVALHCDGRSVRECGINGYFHSVSLLLCDYQDTEQTKYKVKEELLSEFAPSAILLHRHLVLQIYSLTHSLTHTHSWS
jgi:hypothetical protein